MWYPHSCNLQGWTTISSGSLPKPFQPCFRQLCPTLALFLMTNFQRLVDQPILLGRVLRCGLDLGMIRLKFVTSRVRSPVLRHALGRHLSRVPIMAILQQLGRLWLLQLLLHLATANTGLAIALSSQRSPG